MFITNTLNFFGPHWKCLGSSYECILIGAHIADALAVQQQPSNNYRKLGNFRYMKFSLKKFSCSKIFTGSTSYENISTRKFYNIEVGKNASVQLLVRTQWKWRRRRRRCKYSKCCTLQPCFVFWEYVASRTGFANWLFNGFGRSLHMYCTHSHLASHEYVHSSRRKFVTLALRTCREASCGTRKVFFAVYRTCT